MVKKILNTFVKPAAFIVLFFVLINRVVFAGGWFDIAYSTFPKVFKECLLWLLDGALFLWLAIKHDRLNTLWLSWKKNWLFSIFFIFAIASIIWSKYLPVSFYKIFILIFCSLVAACVGIIYSHQSMIRKLSWFFIVLIILSYSLIFFFPGYGIHSNDIHAGAWRGIFFQKNTLAIMMAFGSVFILYRISIEKILHLKVVFGIFYISAAFLIFFSQSAAGKILFLISIFLMLIFYFWVKMQSRLNRWHYMLAGSLLILLALIAILNLEKIFGLFNRDSSISGRIPLWAFVIRLVWGDQPWLGGGFGFPWSSHAIRWSVQQAIGWGFAPITSHNGYIDIFLHLGLVGLLLFSAVLIFTLYRSIKTIVQQKTFFNSFLFALLILIFLANISESLFLELESFIWFLIVYIIFSTSVQPETASLPSTKTS